jgi:hypothetical protein
MSRPSKSQPGIRFQSVPSNWTLRAWGIAQPPWVFIASQWNRNVEQLSPLRRSDSLTAGRIPALIKRLFRFLGVH